MKKLYFLLLFFSSIFLHAQNWQAVYSDRVVYFDSSRQAIKIVSISVDSTGDSTFKNYPYLLMDSTGKTEYFYGRIYDSTSWIGRKIVVKNNGYNGFANDSNEISWLNTLANMGDTFTYFDSKKIIVKGYCYRTFYADTLGVKDSIKHFKFIYSKKPGYTVKFDSTLEILLSKYHGLLKTPPYCAFRSSETPGYIYLPTTTYTYFPENLFTNKSFNTLDVGDEYEYKITNDENRDHYYEDRYYYQVTKKKIVVGTDSVTYTFLVKKLALHRYKAIKYPYGPYDWYWQTITNHYVYNETKALAVDDGPVNGLLPNQLVTFNFGLTSKVFCKQDVCNLVVEDIFYGILRENDTNFFQPPFESGGGQDYYSHIGKLVWWEDGSTGLPNGVGQNYEIIYKNFCNTQYGTPWAKYYVYG